MFFQSTAADPVRERIIEHLVNDLGISREVLESNPSLDQLKIDSLDVVELVMEIDEEMRG